MGVLKVWDPVLEEYVAVTPGMTVRDGLNANSEPNADTLIFPYGTVHPNADGSVEVREVPVRDIGCKAFHSTSQGSLGSGTYNALSMNSEDWDTDGFHDTASNTSRLTIPSHLTGARDYLVIARTYITTSKAIPYIRKNGSSVVAGGSDSTDQPIEVAVVLRLSPGDYVEFTPLHTSGTQTAGGATRDIATEMSITLIGSGNAASLPSVRAKRTSGSVTLNSTTWANVDTGMDLAIPAQVGDVLMTLLSGLWGNEAVNGYLDAATIVGGSPVNYIGGTGGASERGVAGWNGEASVNENIAGGAQYVVQEGDISSGIVTLRLRYRTSSATDKILFATADIPLAWSVVNLKGGTGPSPIPALNLYMYENFR